MLSLLLASFVTFFVAIDPVAMAPMFTTMTSRMTPEWRRKMAFKSIAIATGILLAFGQVMRLFKEVRWVNSFRTGSGERAEPVLLAPMKSLLSRTQATALSTSSMRSILDSIATRLDESRDIARYLIGLLVISVCSARFGDCCKPSAPLAIQSKRLKQAVTAKTC